MIVSLVSLDLSDAGEVLTLQRAAYVTEAQAHDDPHLSPLTQSLDQLRDEMSLPSVRALGYRSAAGRLIAAIRVHVDRTGATASIVRLAVAPDLQGQGLGSRLLAEAEASLPPEVAQIRLFTGEHSARNLRLYSRRGYEEHHRESTPTGYSLVHLVKHIPRR